MNSFQYIYRLVVVNTYTTQNMGDFIWLHPVSIGSDCRQAWLSCLQLMDEMQKRQLNPGASECAMGG
jgi:hypothetical protein